MINPFGFKVNAQGMTQMFIQLQTNFIFNLKLSQNKVSGHYN